jgi:3-deoxy-D-manno-octulosonic-acid transferase
MTPFSLFYLCIALILYILAIPFLILLAFKQKYQQSVPARFALLNNSSFKQRGIWFHVASLGEAKSLKPLTTRLDDVINISTITQTGFAEASKLTKNSRYLPFELFLPFWINRQKALVVSEAELWYLLFFIAKTKGAKTYLINARISDNSYKSYLKFSWLYRRIFENIDMIFAQSQKDKDRLQKLGGKNIVVNGNIKAFQEIEVTKEFKKPLSQIITLASTHKSEEDLILKNIKLEKNQKLIVVPRHPERFDEVDKLLKEYSKENSFTYHRFTQNESFDSDIVLVDKMGELINIYAITDVVILAGSFVDGIGGHNPLEPAHFGCKVLSGEYIFNQLELFKLVDDIEIVKIEEINDKMHKLKSTKIVSGADINPIIEELSKND